MKKTGATIVLSIFSVALLYACYHTVKPGGGPGALGPKPKKSFDVRFVAAGPNLIIVSPDQGCGNGEDGCVRVESEFSADITFGFNATQHYPCADHPNSHYLKQIELANVAKGFGNPVLPWIVSDFGAYPNGVVWTHTPGIPVSSATIQDKNQFAGEAFYKITVAQCSDGSEKSNDPRIRNEG